MSNFDSKKNWGIISSVILNFFLVYFTENLTYFFLLLLIPFYFVAIKTKFSSLFYLLFLLAPISIDFELFNGSQISLASELLLITLLVSIPFVHRLSNNKLKVDFRDPIIIIISIQYLLFFLSILISVETTKSIKYFIAKTWYIIPIFYFSISFIKKPHNIINFTNAYLIGTTIVVVYTIIQHSFFGFSFEKINKATPPFNHNHVNYSTLIAIAFPYLLLIKQSTNHSKISLFIKKHYWIILTIFTFAIISSYTRATWLAIIVMFIAFIIFKLKAIKPILYISLGIGIIGITILLSNNKFLDYAPDYESTIFHKGDFDNHLKATYQMKDVSGMERVYRWVSVIEMAKEKPLLGFGTNTFYPTYKNYTNYLFKTYVSDNPEKSTTHNYFLLLLAEQGILGLILFIILIFYFLIKSQNLYFSTSNKNIKYIIVCNYLSMTILIVHLFLNDLIEVDKFAIMFFFQLVCLYICKKLENQTTLTLDNSVT